MPRFIHSSGVSARTVDIAKQAKRVMADRHDLALVIIILRSFRLAESEGCRSIVWSFVDIVILDVAR